MKQHKTLRCTFGLLLFAAHCNAQSVELIAPQIATGAGWMTDLYLSNTGSASAPYTIELFDESGRPLILPPEFSIPPKITGELRQQQTTVVGISLQPTHSLRQGWARIQVPPSVIVNMILTQVVPGRVVNRASVPLTADVSARIRIPYINNGGLVTSIACANADTVSYPVTSLVGSGEFGNGTVNDALNLPAGTRIAFSLAEKYPQSKGHMGFVTLSAPGNRSKIACMSLVFDESSGAFTVMNPRYQ